jgi:hypothetical protein
MAPGNGNGWNGKRESQWRLTKEKILMFSGLVVIFMELANAEILGHTFHFEFLIAGLALCGISIAAWGDKR